MSVMSPRTARRRTPVPTPRDRNPSTAGHQPAVAVTTAPRPGRQEPGPDRDHDPMTTGYPSLQAFTTATSELGEREPQCLASVKAPSSQRSSTSRSCPRSGLPRSRQQTATASPCPRRPLLPPRRPCVPVGRSGTSSGPRGRGSRVAMSRFGILWPQRHQLAAGRLRSGVAGDLVTSLITRPAGETLGSCGGSHDC